MKRQNKESRHFAPSRIANLGSREKAGLRHLATCERCRKLVLQEEAGEVTMADVAPEAAGAIYRLLAELEKTDTFETEIRAVEEERRAATLLLKELRENPDSWGTAGSDPRYGSPELVWLLLHAAHEETPALALRLVTLAGEIADHLAAAYPGTSLYRQLQVEVRCGRSDSLLDILDHRAAARELKRAARLLTPDLEYGRAVFCRSLAKLKWEQKRWEEALALIDRAVLLFDDQGADLEASQAQIEQGWLLNEAGEADEAKPLLAGALPAVRSVPSWEVVGRLGLAVAHAETGDRRLATRELAEAHRLISDKVDNPEVRVRLRWRAAMAACLCGHDYGAVRRLCQALQGFLALGQEYEATQVLLDLLDISHKNEWPRLIELRRVKLGIGILKESPHLHVRAKGALDLALFALRESKQTAAEVLRNVRCYFTTARYQPQRPLVPIRYETRITLAWDTLDVEFRRQICKEVGTPEAVGTLASAALDSPLRDFIAWRYEILRRVQITFGEPDIASQA